MARLRSSILVAAIVRLAAQKSGSAYIRRRGSDEAGSIFITLYDRNARNYALYEPVPQALAAEEAIDRDSRAFSLLENGQDEMALSDRFDRESNFDPDFWVVDIEGMDEQDLAEAVIVI